MTNDSYGSRIVKASTLGLLTGAFIGSVKGAWAETPAKYRSTDMRVALRLVGANSALFGAVTFTYAATECAVEGFRGQKGALNSVIGGIASGIVIGLAASNHKVALASAGTLGLIAGSISFFGEDLIHDNQKAVERINPWNFSKN